MDEMFNRIFIHVYVGIKYIILIQTSITCTDRYIINIYMYIYIQKKYMYMDFMTLIYHRSN